MLREVFGPGAINAMVAIGIFNIPVFARVAYGAALPLWTRDFIMAARVRGQGPTARSRSSTSCPTSLGILIVQATIQLSLGILAEAALSYVGLGVQPPQPSWGRMLNEAQTLMALAPRLALVPGLAIIITVLGLNLLGDGLRDLSRPPPGAGALRWRCSSIEGLDLSPSHGAPILRGMSTWRCDAGRGAGRSSGESGSGKSMTALSMMRLLPRGAVAGGAIRFDGQGPARLARARHVRRARPRRSAWCSRSR